MRARESLVLALLATTGCVCLPVLSGPAPRDGGAALGSASGLVDLRGIVHCHSLLSHDSSGTFESIAEAAAETSCSFVVLTDHLQGLVPSDEGPDERISGVLFVPGAELNMNGGSLLSIGARKGLDPRLIDAELVRAIRERGGLAAIAHPESIRLEGTLDVDGCELENVHASTTAETKLTLALRAIFYPPRPFFSSIVERDARAAAVYDAFARTRPLAAIGACDAHEAIRPLGPLAGAVDSYRRLFRCATTHVLLSSSASTAAFTKAELLQAIAQGRTYAACELMQDATGFRFVARDRSGAVRATLGGSVPLEPGLVLEVALPRSGGIVILRDGAPTLVVKDGETARWEPVVPGAYRVEATFSGRPWIWSSAIRVEK
ncbi:hypothetical protein HY251_21490 [bacterium]|nr:hypothetical protein [bacterium]